MVPPIHMPLDWHIRHFYLCAYERHPPRQTPSLQDRLGDKPGERRQRLQPAMPAYRDRKAV